MLFLALAIFHVVNCRLLKDIHTSKFSSEIKIYTVLCISDKKAFLMRH